MSGKLKLTAVAACLVLTTVALALSTQHTLDILNRVPKFE